VIKADGLALGKGVIIAQTQLEAEQAVRAMLEGNVFGQAGSRVIIESFLTGPELTVLALPMARLWCRWCPPEIISVPLTRTGTQYRRHGDDSPRGQPFRKGPATPDGCDFQPTIDAMASEGCPFKGVIYFGLMLTPTGPKVIEYNARFGDPEAQVVLPLLETDLMEICLAVLEERLDQIKIRWQEDRSACCVVMASGGYPGSYTTGYPISGLDTVTRSLVFHAGTRQEGSQIVTAGGRVLGVTAVADSLEDAIDQAYQDVAKIHFVQAHYRKDIGRT